MLVRCPRCGTEVLFEGNPFRPFCSERCKLIDLGNWASGAYRVPGTTGTHASEDGEPATSEDRVPPADDGAENGSGEKP